MPRAPILSMIYVTSHGDAATELRIAKRGAGNRRQRPRNRQNRHFRFMTCRDIQCRKRKQGAYMLWKITAKELTNWADNRVSQGDLPELIRRLIHSTIPSSKISSH